MAEMLANQWAIEECALHCGRKLVPCPFCGTKFPVATSIYNNEDKREYRIKFKCGSCREDYGLVITYEAFKYSYFGETQ